MKCHLLLVFNFISLLRVNSDYHISIPSNLDPAVLREAFLEPTALIQFHGYAAENHTITTSDGYVLTVHRIPNDNQSAIPFLLMHGATCSSTQFFIVGEKSPAYLLANAGYDIWMGNFRGSPYSSHTKHKYKNYWDFSWQEMGEEDLPATIDYILNYRNKSKLFLAAQSLGSTAAFALLASQPSYNDKVLCYFALTPVTSILYNPVIFNTEAHRLLERFYSPVSSFIQTVIGQHQVGNVWDIFLNMTLEFCSHKTFSHLCEFSFGLFIGYNPYLHNQTLIPVFIGRCHHGSTIKTVLHYSQLMKGKEMRKFDYGENKNKALYNSTIPPLYNMSEITAPVVLFHSPNDPLGNPLDVELLSKQLRNLKGKELCPWPLCNHVDIMTSTNASQFLCDTMVSHAKQLQEI